MVFQTGVWLCWQMVLWLRPWLWLMLWLGGFAWPFYFREYNVYSALMRVFWWCFINSRWEKLVLAVGFDGLGLLLIAFEAVDNLLGPDAGSEFQLLVWFLDKHFAEIPYLLNIELLGVFEAVHLIVIEDAAHAVLEVDYPPDQQLDIEMLNYFCGKLVEDLGLVPVIGELEGLEHLVEVQFDEADHCESAFGHFLWFGFACGNLA